MDEPTEIIMKFATKAVHAGYTPDPTATGAIMPPIYMSSTFVQEAPGVNHGYDYTRAHNPNYTILEGQLAALENAKYATVFSAGLGALTAMLTLLSGGDRVVALDGLYGGSYRLFTQIFNRFGIQFESVPLAALETTLSKGKKPAWLFFETPTNPLLEIYDIENLATLAHSKGITTVVDNTFATPYAQNPLDLGVDLVWHSSTKYLGGHSDVIGGVVMTQDKAVKEKLDFARKSLGVNPSPFDCWLITRGVKTLPLRMEQHQKNAQAIAHYLHTHTKVEKVYYPGLESHRGYAIAKKQMRNYGGMLSVEFKLSLEETKRMIASFKLFSLAESLGGVESLVNHPVTMTHGAVPVEERARMGLRDSLVRLSIGIEDAGDLIEDLDLGLANST